MNNTPCFYLDDEASWPVELRRLLAEHFETLRHFERERRRIDSLCEKDVHARCNPPENIYESVRNGVLERAGTIIAGLDVVGYHCTRLHPEEIASIERQGIRMLSTEFLTARIRERQAAGDLPAEIAERLIAKNQAHEQHRRGMVWFVFNRRLLKDERGIERFFRYWGGESLYRLHAIDAVTALWIKKIGVPCILEAAIAVASIASRHTKIPERLLSVYLLNREVSPEIRDDAEGYVEIDVTADRVRRVIRLGEADFTSLTACDRWDVMPS